VPAEEIPVPTYAYTCTACGHAFDIHQSFTDDTLTVCPKCAGRLRKVFTPVGITFKGSGFYHTDSRSAHKHTHATNGTSHAKTPAETAATTSKSAEAGASSGATGGAAAGAGAAGAGAAGAGAGASTGAAAS
jgi:putative FmdB family regulatory protein